jgi:hypothetical protein
VRCQSGVVVRDVVREAGRDPGPSANSSHTSRISLYLSISPNTHIFLKSLGAVLYNEILVFPSCGKLWFPSAFQHIATTAALVHRDTFDLLYGPH